jgi:transcriptional regulator of arginine metabolism
MQVIAYLCKLLHRLGMNELKERRQRAMAELIRSDAVASQEELAERLSSLGFAVTQATISRDLERIGAVKVRRGGQSTYSLPEQLQSASGPRLASVLRDFARSIEAAASLVVIKTPPGSAHLVGVALDQSELAEIVGTICGDDTIFVACESAEKAAALATTLGAETTKLQ